MEISVRSGDSFAYYSRIFALPLNQIIEANPSISFNELTVGMSVSIPDYELRSYQIKEGDTLWGIAQQFKIPLDRLLLVNQTVTPNLLKIGHTIDVPIRCLTPGTLTR